MTFKRKICAKTRALAYVMVLEEGKSYRKTAALLNISPSSVYRCCKEGVTLEDKKKGKRTIDTRGRPKILSTRDVSHFLRTFKSMRNNGQNPTVKEIMNEAGIRKGSYRTYIRILNDAGYKKLQPRKKGLLSKKDMKNRKVFAIKALKEHEDTFWTRDIALYLDAVSFIHKHNPFNQASYPKGRVYRKASEGLEYTTTGSKALAGGRRVHVLVAISYNGGIVLAEQYEKMTGNFFADFIRRRLPRAFIDARVQSRRGRMAKMILMDNDPCQNSVVARGALKEIGATCLKIPARSPDLNPIENVFHNVKRELQQQALNKKITKESYTEFSERVITTLLSFDKDVIKRTISTMPRRLRRIIETDGHRTKY